MTVGQFQQQVFRFVALADEDAPAADRQACVPPFDDTELDLGYIFGA